MVKPRYMVKPRFSFTGPNARSCLELARGIQTLFFDIANGAPRHADGTPALRAEHLSALNRAADTAAKVGVKAVAPTPEWFRRFFN
jgi:hypothetical protein